MNGSAPPPALLPPGHPCRGSIGPVHKQAWLLAQPIYVEGLAHSMGESGIMPDAEGLGSSGLAERFAAGRPRWRELPENLLALILFGGFVRSRHPGRYYVKAQHLRRTIRRAYDEVLSDYDLLLMPTTPMAATPCPRPTPAPPSAPGALARCWPTPALSTSPAIPPSPCRAAPPMTAAGGNDAGGAALRRDKPLSGGVCV